MRRVVFNASAGFLWQRCLSNYTGETIKWYIFHNQNNKLKKQGTKKIESASIKMGKKNQNRSFSLWVVNMNKWKHFSQITHQNKENRQKPYYWMSLSTYQLRYFVSSTEFTVYALQTLQNPFTSTSINHLNTPLPGYWIPPATDHRKSGVCFTCF